jgi:hypothetical protein
MKIVDTPRAVTLIESDDEKAIFKGPIVRQVGFGTASFTDEFRDWLFGVQDGECGYCGASLGDTWSGNKDAHVEHIKPRRLGGQDCPPNLMFACKSCNSMKSNHFFRSLHLKWALRDAGLHGVITCEQAKKLVDMGFLDLEVGSRFHFEIEGWAHVYPLPTQEDHDEQWSRVYSGISRKEIRSESES